MGEESLAEQFAADIALLKQVGINPVVVHGGGPQINAMLQRLAIQSTFVDGLRVTDAAMVEVVEMVLAVGVVGEPTSIDARVIHALTGGGLVPVIAPVGVGADGQTYNINADTVAAAVAGALNATRLLMLTDVPGVLDKDKNLIPSLTLAQVEERIADGTITGGMIPKVENCVEAVRQGVRGAVILDGRVPHACLLELFTEAGP